MKKLFKISILLFASCGGEKSESTEEVEVLTLENLSYTTDTLAVNISDEIFNAYGYYGDGLSQDGTTIYLFNDQESEIHEIDVNSMTLVERHPFEKDGPNKIPSFVNYFQTLPGDEFLLSNSNSSGIYSLSGKLVQKLNLTTESVSGFDEKASSFLTNSIHITEDKSKAITLPRAFSGGISGLGIIDLASKKGINLELPAMKITEKYRVTFREGNGSSSAGDYENLQMLNGNFVIYSGATSDIYLYDPSLDSLSLLTFPHKIVPKSKQGNYPTEVDSPELITEIRKEMGKEIRFGRFYWDAKNERYMRFAQKNKYDVEGKMIGGEFYVFTYSKDFKLTAEGEFKNYNPNQNMGFFKDGKLYCYTPVDEIPGFVVYTFDF
ncbi:protein of unknown function [Algoriphagus locisalis]|uniref:DUF4221 domain-containing protein n=1 Tax=Algoriphagus locisalis TaxID=305507 RepID=A0A1I7ANL8_9BACT|nr:DUF4221 family protein [Algoriphagus locisalis]SFT76560.1 protein of unknown function [Algoriphagus locisalis]